VTGEYQGTISEDAIRGLLTLFESYEFLDLQFHCNILVNDAPATRIRLKIGGRERVIDNVLSGRMSTGDPEEDQHASAHQHLHEIAGTIDEAVEIEQWIGSPEDRRTAFKDSWREIKKNRRDMRK
jgi:hypothetical protein